MVLLCFTIGLENKFTGKINLDKIKDCFNKNKIFYSICSSKNNNRIFIKTFLDNDENKKISCDIFSEYIFENYIINHINYYMDEYYEGLTDITKNEIIKSFFNEFEMDFVSKKLLDYLNENNTLIVEGFVNFRLNRYLDISCERIDSAIEDIMIKNEYNELIGYLKYFVNSQSSKYDVINIVKYKNGSYNLYDSSFNVVEIGTRGDFMFEFAEEEFCINDVLINDLINLSPKRVVIHNKENFETNEILKTVESIFETNFSYCVGCKFCKNIE